MIPPEDTVVSVLRDLKREVRELRHFFEKLADDDLELRELRESRESGKTRKP